MAFHEDKRALRRRARALRDELARTVPLAGERVLQHLRLGGRPQVVAGTMPIGSELDPRPLMRHLEAFGARLALPRTPPLGQPLTFHAWTPGTRLSQGPFGIEEPAPDAELLSPDLVLVPLLAFDRRGARLGSGGGYYDVTLRALRRQGPVFALGVGYAGQEVPCVPSEPHDERLDAIVTEREWIEPDAG